MFKQEVIYFNAVLGYADGCRMNVPVGCVIQERHGWAGYLCKVCICFLSAD